MSAENLQGVEVKRIRAGLYLVGEFLVEDVKGTTGWCLTASGGKTHWFGSLSKAKSWVAGR